MEYEVTKMTRELLFEKLYVDSLNINESLRQNYHSPYGPWTSGILYVGVTAIKVTLLLPWQLGILTMTWVVNAIATPIFAALYARAWLYKEADKANDLLQAMTKSLFYATAGPIVYIALAVLESVVPFSAYYLLRLSPLVSPEIKQITSAKPTVAQKKPAVPSPIEEHLKQADTAITGLEKAIKALTASPPKPQKTVYAVQKEVEEWSEKYGVAVESSAVTDAFSLMPDDEERSDNASKLLLQAMYYLFSELAAKAPKRLRNLVETRDALQERYNSFLGESHTDKERLEFLERYFQSDLDEDLKNELKTFVGKPHTQEEQVAFLKRFSAELNKKEKIAIQMFIDQNREKGISKEKFKELIERSLEEDTETILRIQEKWEEQKTLLEQYKTAYLAYLGKKKNPATPPEETEACQAELEALDEQLQKSLKDPDSAIKGYKVNKDLLQEVKKHPELYPLPVDQADPNLSFCTDMTQSARNGELPRLIGREKELADLITTLTQKEGKCNPVLVGDPGVGKTALIEGLCYKIINDEVPELKGYRIIRIDFMKIMSGITLVGMVEQRFKDIFEAMKQGKIILFFDEIHLVMGAGSYSSKPWGMENYLKSYLDGRGSIKIIGATTTQEYAKLAADAALERRLQPIRIAEMDEGSVKNILYNCCLQKEKELNIPFAYAAIDTVYKKGKKLLSHFFPDKGLEIIKRAFLFIQTQISKDPDILLEVKKNVEEMTLRLGALKRSYTEDSDNYKQYLREEESKLSDSDLKNLLRQKIAADYRLTKEEFLRLYQQIIEYQEAQLATLTESWKSEKSLIEAYYAKCQACRENSSEEKAPALEEELRVAEEALITYRNAQESCIEHYKVTPELISKIVSTMGRTQERTESAARGAIVQQLLQRFLSGVELREARAVV